jgi:uncharacterized protein YajQ (UPF0234 family)
MVKKLLVHVGQQVTKLVQGLSTEKAKEIGKYIKENGEKVYNTKIKATN